MGWPDFLKADGCNPSAKLPFVLSYFTPPVRPEVSKGSAVLNRCPSIPQDERGWGRGGRSLIKA